MRRRLRYCLAAAAIILQPAPLPAKPLATYSAEAINGAEWSAAAAAARSGPLVLKAQVLLARAGFSPGAIDGRDGENFQKALGAFQQAHGAASSGRLDQATWRELAAQSNDDVVKPYVIQKDD